MKKLKTADIILTLLAVALLIAFAAALPSPMML